MMPTVRTGMSLLFLAAALASCNGPSDEPSNTQSEDDAAERQEAMHDEEWLESSIASVLDKQIPSDGSISVTKEGSFVLLPSTWICGHPSEPDLAMREVGLGAPGLHGRPIADALMTMGLDTHVQGSRRHRDVISSVCGAPGDGNIQYRGVIRPNPEGSPYRLDIVIWQETANHRAFWAGSVARPYLPTWEGPLRVDRDGNLPDGTPYWSLSSDAWALSEKFAEELIAGAGIPGT